MTRFLETHIIQTLPPSNINRDGNNNPKTCVYGGVPRARVSSQAWKKAMRDTFRTLVDSSQLGVRSREFTGVIADKLNIAADDERLLDVTGKLMKSLGLPADKDHPGNTSALQLFGAPQWDTLARITGEALDANDPDTVIKSHAKEARAALDSDRSLDIALFGRMSASDDKNKASAYTVDAACQVAHAFSINPASIEWDYFTAMDEHEGATGAGMIQNSGFMSSTLYRYACIDLHLLDRNLDHDPDALRETVRSFLTAFVHSMPGGKKNSYAPETMPAFILTDIRDTRPINLADAFLAPVPDPAIANGTAALMSRFAEMSTVYGEPEPFTLITAGNAAMSMLDTETREHAVPLPQLIKDTTDNAINQ